MGEIRLGKLHLRWCDACDVPVVEQLSCGICGSASRPVKLTPPGDARPAFAKDVERIRALVDNQFGPGTGELILPNESLVLLNKAPDIDRMDEVIVHGEVVGAVRFGLTTGDRFLLRPPGALAVAERVTRGWVVVDDCAADAIRNKSASTLAVGVLECAAGISVGDEVLVLDNSRKPVSVGTARMSSEQMMGHPRGTAVKTRWKVGHTGKTTCSKATSWNDAVRASRETITRRALEAKEFIRKIIEKNDLPVAVSFSGGKDSLATLLLVLDAGVRPKLLFVDTGLEFEETKASVREAAERHALEVVCESAGDSFWKNVEIFGPPGRDYRWCCKTCKLGPATRLIQKHFPRGVLSFIGQRAYESEQRARKGSVWRNPWTPNQLAASPIQKWTAMHVWLYLFSKRERYNPLYEEGLERIGCFMCPATDVAELNKVKEMGREYQRWQQFLDTYAKRKGRPKAWLEHDLWRWRRIPESVLREIGGLGKSCEWASDESTEERPLEFRATEGYSPCVQGLSMEGVFSRKLDMARVANMLNILGEVVVSPDGTIAELKGCTLFEEGPVMIRGSTERELRQTAARLREVVFRAMNCAGCGICPSRCKNGALRLEGRVVLDPDLCTHCGACLGPCPVVEFKDEELDI